MRFSPRVAQGLGDHFHTIGLRGTPERGLQTSNETGVSKNLDFQQITRYISKTIEDRHN